ncbi:GntR family transcriptional regulator [Geminicoccus roseus]|uniref:GntR family transcriptional regulator n=1 Tax=Geminicoccus roseus TaxID=404900 RepID=UPI00040A5074|nr:GntR family transcriptional regulator [Geminicoccus roseus]
MTIARPTLAQQAYAEIQNKILSGELAAGQRLLPDALAAALAVSQTPVKEALALLERDGLVTGSERRASSVRRFTPQDILEIYEARILLEVNAITTAFDQGRADAGLLARLEAIVEAQLTLFPPASREVLVEIIALDRRLHETIMEAGGNRLLTEWHRSIQLQIQTVRTYSLENYDLERSRREHNQILDALRSGGREGIVAALSHHLASSRDDLIRRHPDELPLRQ